MSLWDRHTPAAFVGYASCLAIAYFAHIKALHQAGGSRASATSLAASGTLPAITPTVPPNADDVAAGSDARAAACALVRRIAKVDMSVTRLTSATQSLQPAVATEPSEQPSASLLGTHCYSASRITRCSKGGVLAPLARSGWSNM